MKRKRHTPEQINKRLLTAADDPGCETDIGNACRKLEVTEAS